MANCYYCQRPLEEMHYQRARETGDYQCTWKGDISCKKCFQRPPKKIRKEWDRLEKLAIKRANEQRKKGPVPILSVPYKEREHRFLTRTGKVKPVGKVIFGKPIKHGK